MKRVLLLFVLLFAVALIPAAAQDSDLPGFDDLTAGEWTQIPVDDAVCLYDTDYSFFVRPADVETDKLMIYFQGGGACWDGLTCGSVGQFASQYDVSDDEMAVYTAGLFDYENESNPVTDFHAVFVPYCSGDIHSGDAEMTFDLPEAMQTDDAADVSVIFNGVDNTSQVLDWVYANFLEPEQVLITGCSAGGYGAATHAPFIMQNYAGIPAVLVSDASNGVLYPGWNGLETWEVVDELPDFVEDFTDITWEDYSTTLQFIATSQAFPDNVFAQYNTFLDQVQIGFYGLMQNVFVTEDNFADIAQEWSTGLLTNLATIEAASDNFYAYTAGGLVHCVVNRPEFYSYSVDGLTVSDWVSGLLAGDPQTVSCDVESGECLVPPATDE